MISNKKVMFIGLLAGITSSICGSFIFSTIEEVRSISQFGENGYRFFITFFVSLLLVILPSIIACSSLIKIFLRQLQRKSLTLTKAIIWGGFLGLAIAIGTSFIVLFLINGKGLLYLFLYRVLEATLLSGSFGVVMGWFLFNYVKQHESRFL